MAGPNDKEERKRNKTGTRRFPNVLTRLRKVYGRAVNRALALVSLFVGVVRYENTGLRGRLGDVDSRKSLSFLFGAHP